jgi:hypothetical protein
MNELITRWLNRADELDPYAPAAAEAYRRAADELRDAVRDHEMEALTVDEAAEESGFSAGHLRRLVQRGKLPNAGAKGSPRIRRRDLPRKPNADERSVAEVLGAVAGAADVQAE